MKKSFKSVLAVMLIITVALSLAACGIKTSDGIGTSASAASTTSSTQTQAPETVKPLEDVKMSIWINAYITTEEQKKPQEEWGLSKILKKFEAENPGVTVELTVPADQQAAHQTFKAAAMAKNGPDVANLWAGMPLFALRDVVLHLDGKVPQEDLDNLMGWEFVRDNFEADGAILGYPATGYEYGCFLYNKKLVSDAGLDFENSLPGSADDFVAALKKIKDAGVLPIAADESGYNAAYVFTFGAWWSQLSGTARIASNSMGTTKFADDKGFLDTMAKTAEIYKLGLINKDYATSKDAGNKFNQGKAALLVTGNWGIADAISALGEENVGIIPMPKFSPDAKFDAQAIGGTGQSLVVANYTENTDLAIKLCSFLNNKENTLEVVKTLSKIPLRKDITTEEMGWKGKPVYEKSYEISKHLLFWTDNAQQPDVMNEYYKMGTLVLTGKMTPQEAAKQLDQKAAEVNKN